MTELPKFSLGQQIEAVRFAETRQRAIKDGGTLRELRAPKVAEFDMQRLGAAARTLETLQENADEIRAFLKLPAEARQAVLQHGATLAEICVQMVKAEAVAKAGGPAR